MATLRRLALFAGFALAPLAWAYAEVESQAAPPDAAQPVESLGEAGRDQVEAAAQFATAETLFKQGELDAALRAYQRAHFWDPSKSQPLEKIVPLAFSLERADEAVRYALLEADAADAAMLRRLAVYLNEQGDYASAVRIYRLWLDRSAGEANASSDARVARLIIQLQVGRIAYLLDEVEQASQSFEVVQRVLTDEADNSPERNRLRQAANASSPEFWELLGQCHWEAGRGEIAREAFQQMAQSPEAAPRADYWLAELAAAEQPYVAYEKLKSYFDLRDDAYGGQPYELLQKVLTGLNDRQGLKADLGRLSAGGRPYAKAALADALDADGDRKRAEELYRNLLTDDAVGLADQQLSGRAAEWLITRLGEDRRLGDLVLLLPAIGAAVSDLDSLTPALESALEEAPQAELLSKRLAGWSVDRRSAEELGCGAWAARTAGQLDIATKLHRAAVERDGDNGGGRSLVWAIDLLFGDEPGLGAKELTWGLEKQLWQDGDALPYFYLATALGMDEQHDAALDAAREASDREPDTADFAARVAWVLFNAERTEEAIAEYKRVIEDFSDDPDPGTRETLKDARMTVSYLVLEQGDADAAAEWLLQVLDEFPGDAGAMNDLAYLWADRGEHLERSLRMAKAATAQEPDNAAYLDTLAWAQFRSGRQADALATVDRALQVAAEAGEEPDGEILAHRGDILAALGRRAEAIKVWKEAAERLVEPNPELAEKVREKLKAKAE